MVAGLSSALLSVASAKGLAIVNFELEALVVVEHLGAKLLTLFLLRITLVRGLLLSVSSCTCFTRVTAWAMHFTEVMGGAGVCPFCARKVVSLFGSVE